MAPDSTNSDPAIRPEGMISVDFGGRGEGKVLAGFLGRRGGASTPPYDSLNLSTATGDSPVNRVENRMILSRYIDPALDNLLLITQVHGSEIHVLKNREELCDHIIGDGVVTELKGVPLGILTADCLPLLLYDPVKGAIGAVHAGWRGTVKGVVPNALRAMVRNFGTNVTDIVAALGPVIGPCCYEVDTPVIEEFKGAFGGAALSFIHEEREGRGLLDIKEANRFILLASGLKEENIFVTSPCTSCNIDMYFSYRVASRESSIEPGGKATLEGVRTGRQLSFIMLRES